jgi:hypothetical protein
MKYYILNISVDLSDLYDSKLVKRKELNFNIENSENESPRFRASSDV